jgi:hypothetical protein
MNTKHFPLNLQSNAALLKLRNFGGGEVWTPQPPPPRYATAFHLTSLYTMLTKFKNSRIRKYPMSHLCIPYFYEHQSTSVSGPSILCISVLIKKLILAQLAVEYQIQPRIGISASAMWIMRWNETKVFVSWTNVLSQAFHVNKTNTLRYKVKQILEGLWWRLPPRKAFDTGYPDGWRLPVR